MDLIHKKIKEDKTKFGNISFFFISLNNIILLLSNHKFYKYFNETHLIIYQTSFFAETSKHYNGTPFSKLF